MKILLPVCGADDARLIVDFVVNYHWPPHSSFKVIHVLGSSDTEAEVAQAEKDALELVDGVIDRLKKIFPAVQMDGQVIPGAAIYEILATASKWKTDMIVMGYRTRADIQSFLAGSVSKGVAVQAPCSVAIIRPPECATESPVEQAFAGAESS